MARESGQRCSGTSEVTLSFTLLPRRIPEEGGRKSGKPFRLHPLSTHPEIFFHRAKFFRRRTRPKCGRLGLNCLKAPIGQKISLSVNGLYSSDLRRLQPSSLWAKEAVENGVFVFASLFSVSTLGHLT
jgi:hypothetical protein